MRERDITRLGIKAGDYLIIKGEIGLGVDKAVYEWYCFVKEITNEGIRGIHLLTTEGAGKFLRNIIDGGFSSFKSTRKITLLTKEKIIQYAVMEAL